MKLDALDRDVDLEPRPGRLFAVDIAGSPVRGTYLEVVAPRRVVVSWGVAGHDGLPPGASTVTLTLTPTAQGTRVDVVHSDLPDADRAGHADGWSHFLPRLLVVATGGDPGDDDWVPGGTTTIDRAHQQGRPAGVRPPLARTPTSAAEQRAAMSDHEGLLHRVRAVLGATSVVREVNMFGGRAFMVNEKMLVSVGRGGDLLVRVDPERSGELLAAPGARQAEMGAGRSMGPGWITVAGAAVTTDDALRSWIAVAAECTATAL